MRFARVMFQLDRKLRLLGAALGLATAHAQISEAPPPIPASPPLQLLVRRAARTALEQFQSTKLQSEQLAITLVDLRDAAHPASASYRGDVAIYPASVVKLFYLVAVHRWLEVQWLTDTPELRRAMRDMIVDSSNDATSYLVDLLTDTTSGPELPTEKLLNWVERRNAVNRYFASLDYTGINVNKKPWGDGPYGRETQAMQLFEPRRRPQRRDAGAPRARPGGGQPRSRQPGQADRRRAAARRETLVEGRLDEPDAPRRRLRRAARRREVRAGNLHHRPRGRA
jgi:hypothetical protein